MGVTITVSVITAAVAAAGIYLGTYLNNISLARRQDQLARVNAQLKDLYGPLAAPSIAAMAHNLLRAAGALASLPFVKARAAAIRRDLIAVAAGTTCTNG